MPPLRRINNCSPAPNASTTTAHSLKAMLRLAVMTHSYLMDLPKCVHAECVSWCTPLDTGRSELYKLRMSARLTGWAFTVGVAVVLAIVVLTSCGRQEAQSQTPLAPATLP